MKKLLTFVLALSMVASTCLYAQAVKKNKSKADEKVEETDTLLVYGCSPWRVDEICFMQTDTKLAPSFLKTKGDGHYYGEAVSGGSYKCLCSWIKAYNTVFFGSYGLGLPNDLDFVLPKEKDKIIYLGYKNFNGKNVDEHYVDDIPVLIGREIMKSKEHRQKGELKERKRAITSMRIKYAGTKWEPLLKAELEKVENLQKKLKKGEDLGDEE